MLVSCVAYQAGRKLADIPPDEISNYVARPECFVWVALKDPGPGELAAMQHEFDLHELAVEDALRPLTHRYMVQTPRTEGRTASAGTLVVSATAAPARHPSAAPASLPNRLCFDPPLTADRLATSGVLRQSFFRL